MRTGFKKAVSVALCVLCAAVGIPTASAADNVDTLLSKMTTEEKIAQMITVAVRQWDGEDFTVMEDDVANIISTYNRIRRITVYIKGRCKVHIYSQSGKLTAQNITCRFGVVCTVNCTKRHIARQRCACVQPYNLAALLVCTDKQRYFVS